MSLNQRKYRTEPNCLNCGELVAGKFCSNCGQENIETHENFLHLVFHTVGDFFHFDSKFFRSLIPLIIKPGFLTLEYWSGKRTKYIHPLRLFFFVTIMMVLIANMYYHKYEKHIKQERIRISSEQKSSTSQIRLHQHGSINGQTKKIVQGANKAFDYAASYLKYISFIMLPFYALAFKLLYSRNNKMYIAHLVYTLHLQSFVYILLSVGLLIPMFLAPSARSWFMNVILVIATVYMLLSLRRIYNQSWIKTILKSLIILGWIFIVTALFIAIAIIINI